jgi:aldehyde dehydrogenase (NAD+)
MSHPTGIPAESSPAGRLSGAPSIPDEAQRVRATFAAGITRPLAWRREQLRALDRLLVENTAAIEDAVHSDLGKPSLESFITEIASVRSEIAHTLSHLAAWTRPRRVHVPLAVQPAQGRIVRQPLGTVLLISPWNYPVHLLLMPLVAALAAGNTVVVKPSELAPATSSLAAGLLPLYLDRRAVAVIEGGVEETTELLALPWDHILYTGNGTVGRVVLEAAARHLTPVTLELGGKSPVWVDGSADLRSTARWLAWGKFLNAGQTCIAPDYVLTTPDVLPRLVEALRTEIATMYGPDPRQSPDYGRVVNERHLQRILALIGRRVPAIGGEADPADRYLAPTVLTGVCLDDPVMQDEIFGPVLPIVMVHDADEAIRVIGERDKPLALYVFTRSAETRNAFVERTSSGSIVVNGTVLQLAALELPFGGVGASGMGAYHGEHGVATFSHDRAYLRMVGGGSALIGLSQPPYTPFKQRAVRGRAAQPATTSAPAAGR